VLHSAEEGQSLVGRVRLTKLLFLTELEFFRAYRRRLTDLQWVFYHYGPYVMSIEERFRSLPFRETDDHESGLRGWRVQEWEARGLDHLEIPERVERVADEVCRRWATERLGKLLDFVYYDTEPMEHAGRGETLGFDQVGDANPLPRPVSKVSPDLRKRLDGVRSPFTAADSIRIKWPSPDEAKENRGAERMDLGQIARALNQRT
jgi:hypothetical protein